MKQGWEIKKLGEVCSITMGQSPSSDTYNDSEGLPFFQGNADFGKIHPSIRVYCNAPIRIADVDDILISVRAPIGAINIADCKCCIGRGLASIRNNAEVANEYIYHALIANKEKLIAQGTGSTFKSIGKEALKELSIPVPPREEQERIVAELDCLSGVIEKKREQLKQLDALAQSIFYQMFDDPITNEKGWEVKKLKNITSKIGSGATPKGGNESYKDEGISLIRSLNVHNNLFVYKDLAHIDEEQADALKNVVVEDGDVLLNITGASVARCCVVPNDVLPARVNQHVAIIRPKELGNNIFICYQFTSNAYQQELLSIGKSNGATREALTKGQLEELDIIMPPLALQQEFADKIEAIEKQKELIKKSISETETLFNARMDYYFN